MQVSALLYRSARSGAPTCDVARVGGCSKRTLPIIVSLRAAKIRSVSYRRDAYVQKLHSCEDVVLAGAAELMPESGQSRRFGRVRSLPVYPMNRHSQIR